MMAQDILPFTQVKPTKATITLDGRPINLSQMALELNMDQGYLSRIMSGERKPRVDYIERVANALGMTIDEFLRAVDRRAEILRAS